VFIHINTSNFKILKGSPLYYLPTLKAKYYPDCSIKRSWSPTETNYTTTLRAPTVDEETSFPITTTVNYTDFYGNVHIKNVTTNVTVVPTRPACIRVVVERKDISVTIYYANETELEEPGELNIKIKNTGYAVLENVTVNLSIPNYIEIATNDTAWRGRIEYEVRRATDILYVFTKWMSWNGSLGVREEVVLPLQIRGVRSGLYEIPYVVAYDEKELKGSFGFMVKGAILSITKELDKYVVNATEDVNVVVRIKNIGEATAKDVLVVDQVPYNFHVIGDTEMGISELKPGEEINLTYTLKAPTMGSYGIDLATVNWKDEYENMYTKGSNKLRLEVIEKKEEKPVEEVIELTRKQLAVTIIFSVIVVGIVFKMLSLRRPAR
jgi:uncharacterized repeat protein (TIGR01451 family)